MSQIFSFEFYPPRSEEAEALLSVASHKLAKLKPEFFSVTFGAGGSTRELTKETVLTIKANTGINAAPHLSGIGSSPEQIREILLDYKENGINRLVALRGDLPSGTYASSGFRYANELVTFIRQETGSHFYIEVAAYPETHPQAISAKSDLEHFKLKIDAGADSAITQYFYNADAYFHFIDNCHEIGIDVPIVPGVMPIANYFQLARFSDACGAEIPRWMRKQLECYGDDRASIQAFGVELVTSLCSRLLEQGAPGLHFYTMNQAQLVYKIWQNLGLAAPVD